MSAIVAEGLTKHFDEVRAVDGIDLEIAPGAIFGFLGANGSGKTTTIRMLTTLLRPTAGSARIEGLDVISDARAVRRRIGVVLQEAGLDDMQTGRELLTLQARLFGLRGAALRERVGELLDIVDLAAADRAVGGYSGGMKRRLDLATALVHRPGVIFLDEPTTGLDPVSRQAIWRYVNQLSVEDGITVFLTTQYLEEADRLAHDLAIIDEGRIIARGSPAAMKARISTDVVTVRVGGPAEALTRAATVAADIPAVERVQTADGAAVVYVPDGARAVARIVLALDEAGIEVGDVAITRPSLDDVFLQATGHHLQVEDLPAAEGGAS